MPSCFLQASKSFLEHTSRTQNTTRSVATAAKEMHHQDTAPEADGASVVKYLVVFVRGGGSTWLQALLNKVQGFVCHRETVLNQTFFEAKQSTEELKYEGYKNKMKHIPEWSQQRIEDGGAKVKLIFLHRRDIVRNAVGNWRKSLLASREISRGSLKAGMGNAYHISHVPPAAPIPLEDFQKEVDYLQLHNKEMNEFRDRLRERGVPFLDIYYEDMLEDIDGVLSAVYEYITGCKMTQDETMGKDKQPDVPVKNTSDNLRDHVANYDELHDYVVSKTTLTWIE